MERKYSPVTQASPLTSIETPDWVKDAIFYQIFPDRFAQSKRVYKPSNLEGWDTPPTHDGYKGGDLLGVVENLDYLQELGINAIYLNPVFQSTANHRYHTHDYFQVDPILGGNPAFKELLEAAHARDIKVIIDGVFNHASRGFYQFNHALENGRHSPYLDWFYYNGFPVNAYDLRHKPNYDAWWSLPALPKFNTDTPAVRDYLWEVGRYWLEFGADGWRLDVPNEINDDEFWRKFRQVVKGVSPDAYICGEIWEDARRWLQGDQFDSVMNYLFTRACLGFFINPTSFNHSSIQQTSYEGHGGLRGMDAAQFGSYIKDLLALYAPAITQAQLNLLGSHDTPRFLTVAGDDIPALKLATLFQMTYPGAPCVYYGDEIGLQGSKDPDCRRSFPWSQAKWNTELLGYFKQAIALRKEHPALRRGEYDTLYGQEGVYIFGRHDANERLITVLNAGNTVLHGLPAFSPDDVAAYLPEGGQYLDLFARPGTNYPIVSDGARLAGFELPPRSGTVLQLAK